MHRCLYILYQLGPVTIDTHSFNAQEGELVTEVSLAEKGLIGDLPSHEHTGYRSEFSLTGCILPFRSGGLNALDMLHKVCADGERIMVVRGDGAVLGWHAISRITEKHEHFAPNGIGFLMTHHLSLIRVPSPSSEAMGSFVRRLLSLFE